MYLVTPSDEVLCPLSSVRDIRTCEVANVSHCKKRFYDPALHSQSGPQINSSRVRTVRGNHRTVTSEEIRKYQTDYDDLVTVEVPKIKLKKTNCQISEQKTICRHEPGFRTS